jgi:hypothetical protein
MKYEKPQIALLGSAVKAVKGNQTKEDDPWFDMSGYATQSAYQADE